MVWRLQYAGASSGALVGFRAERMEESSLQANVVRVVLPPEHFLQGVTGMSSLFVHGTVRSVRWVDALSAPDRGHIVLLALH